MDILNIEPINSNLLLVENFYKLSVEYMATVDFDTEKFIQKCAAIKNRFVEEVPEIKNLSVMSYFFSDVLVHYEIICRKDLITYSINQILDMIKVLSDKGCFSSSMKYYHCCNIIANYTKWAYDKQLRSDYINTADLTSKISAKDAIKLEKLNEDVLTRDEMKTIIEQVDREDVALGLSCILEGLKTSEILSIEMDRIKQGYGDGLIDVGKRKVKVSEELFSLMEDYSRVKYIMHNARQGKFQYDLYENGYLVRPIVRHDSKPIPMAQTHYSVSARKELKSLGYNTELRAFRNNAIMNDIIDGKDYVFINEKYGLNFPNNPTMKREKEKIEVLEEKRRREGTLIVGAMGKIMRKYKK